MTDVTIGGKRYRLEFARMRSNDGQCDHPQQRGKKIVLNPRIRRNSREYMETVLHEVLHAALWHLDEDFVDQYARDATRILHRLGFRHVGDDPADSRHASQ